MCESTPIRYSNFRGGLFTPLLVGWNDDGRSRKKSSSELVLTCSSMFSHLRDCYTNHLPTCLYINWWVRHDTSFNFSFKNPYLFNWKLTTPKNCNKISDKDWKFHPLRTSKSKWKNYENIHYKYIVVFFYLQIYFNHYLNSFCNLIDSFSQPTLANKFFLCCLSSSNI